MFAEDKMGKSNTKDRLANPAKDQKISGKATGGGKNHAEEESEDTKQLRFRPKGVHNRRPGGRPLRGPEGRPLGPQGRPLRGPEGRPLRGPEGRPLTFDPSRPGRPLRDERDGGNRFGRRIAPEERRRMKGKRRMRGRQGRRQGNNGEGFALFLFFINGSGDFDHFLHAAFI